MFFFFFLSIFESRLAFVRLKQLTRCSDNCFAFEKRFSFIHLGLKTGVEFVQESSTVMNLNCAMKLKFRWAVRFLTLRKHLLFQFFSVKKYSN